MKEPRIDWTLVANGLLAGFSIGLATFAIRAYTGGAAMNDLKDLVSNTNLAYLRQAKQSLTTSEQERILIDTLLGILSILTPEQEWRDSVMMAVRLARADE